MTAGPAADTGTGSSLEVTQGRPVRCEVRVIRNRRVAEATWWLEVSAPEIARRSDPGHFLMVGFGVEGVGSPFIPRPFSVGWCGPDGRVGLLVREFGAGTKRLASLRAEDRLLLLGPLGRGFRVERARPTVCVAGGVGLAPFLFLVPECRRRGLDVRLLYGERNGDRVFDPALVRELTGGPVEVWTEDGTVGCRGLVLEGLGSDWGRESGGAEGSGGGGGSGEEDGSDGDDESGGNERSPGPGVDADTQILACGPTPMLRALAHRARRSGLDLQVSVEEHMGCGVGTCQGCVVPGADGRWIKSCLEGPVFEAGDLAWDHG